MPKVIKLESIAETRVSHSHSIKEIDGRLHICYCPTCGKCLAQEIVVVEHACSNCRHLVDPSETYCSFCGEKLDWSQPLIEHYDKGKKLTDDEYKKRATEIH